MQFRKLGRTDLLVSEIGFGTYKNLDVVSPEGQLHCNALVKEAVHCGTNFFDTAPMYGSSEEVLGNILLKKNVFMLVKYLNQMLEMHRKV